MEGMKLRETNLNDLHDKARALASSARSLADLFDKEAARQNRMEMESRLRDLHSRIVGQLHMVKTTEDTLECSYNQPAITWLTQLAVGSFIGIVFQNKKPLSAIGDQLLKMPAGSQQPFGLVLVSVGPVGVPEGVQVVSVSRLARDSNRAEAEVASELKKQGHLLLSEEEFSLLIDKLIEGVQEGRLTLPISAKKLPRKELQHAVFLKAKRLNNDPPAFLLKETESA